MSEISEELKRHIAALLDEAVQERTDLLSRIDHLEHKAKTTRVYSLLLLATIFAMFVDRIFGLTATCYAN